MPVEHTTRSLCENVLIVVVWNIVQDLCSRGRHRTCHLSDDTCGLDSLSLCQMAVPMWLSHVPGCGAEHKKPEAHLPSSLHFQSCGLSSVEQGQV